MTSKHTLIAVTGLTPQIITETLYTLVVKKGINIDEICIITTKRGKNVIQGKDREYNKKRGYPKLSEVLKNFCEIYDMSKPRLEIKLAAELSTELYDIRNDKHNLLFPNKVCEVIREKSSDKNNILHCSISGGRKTMSVDLAFALSIFGRNEDKLYHILVDEKVEFNKDFWFPRTDSEKYYLELSEIPYVRLSYLLSEVTHNKLFTKMTYTELVSLTQNLLNKASAEKLRFRRKSDKWEVWYSRNEPVEIQPKEVTLYRAIIENKKAGITEIEVLTLVNLLRPEKRKQVSNAAHDLYNENNISQLKSKLNGKIRNAVQDAELIPLFEITHTGGYGSGKYCIDADPDKIEFLS